MCPASHDVPCTLRITSCSGAEDVIDLRVTNASWFAPYTAPSHTGDTEPVVVAASCWLEMASPVVVAATQDPPTTPSGRSKRSSTAVVGKYTPETVIVTDAEAEPPNPSETTSCATKDPVTV